MGRLLVLWVVVDVVDLEEFARAGWREAVRMPCRTPGDVGASHGQTTALAVPAILDAPGTVVATSNKADLWAATHALRSSRLRPVRACPALRRTFLGRGLRR
jgi:hypothetical protein